MHIYGIVWLMFGHVAQRLLAGKAKIGPYPVMMLLFGCQEGQEDAADAVGRLGEARRPSSRPEGNIFIADWCMTSADACNEEADVAWSSHVNDNCKSEP